MEISKVKNSGKLEVEVIGRLDTNTAPELENSISDDLEGIKELDINLKNLDYISSAGLRVILKLHKLMASNGANLYVINPKDEVMEVFDMTGFSTFLNIKE